MKLGHSLGRPKDGQGGDLNHWYGSLAHLEAQERQIFGG